MIDYVIEIENHMCVDAYVDHMSEENNKIVKVNKSKRDYSATAQSVSILEKFNNKSEAIRSLHKDGHSNSAIADMLNIRYQHVRNVLAYEKKK